MKKSPFASKTVWFFLLYAAVNVAGIFGFADFTPSGDQSEIVGLLVAAVGLVLRFLTRQPIT